MTSLGWNLCTAFKKDGAPCTLPSNGPDGLCWVHDPKNASARRRGQSRGGKTNKEARAVRELMDALTEQVLTGELEPAILYAAVAAQNTKLRAIELERKLEETDVRSEFEELKRELGLS